MNNKEIFGSLVINEQPTIVEQEKDYAVYYEEWYKMKEYFKNEAYFDLLRGETVTQAQIVADNANMMFAVDSLIRFGRVVGQYDLWGQLYLYSPAKYRQQERIISTVVGKHNL